MRKLLSLIYCPQIQITLMGFADLSISDIATQYDLQVETLFRLCGLLPRLAKRDRLNISYKNEATCLALEDAKMVILEILSANPLKDDKSQLNQDRKGLKK